MLEKLLRSLPVIKTLYLGINGKVGQIGKVNHSLNQSVYNLYREMVPMQSMGVSKKKLKNLRYLIG